MNQKTDTGDIFELVELEECSGSALKIYSVIIGDDKDTLYDKFLSENEIQHCEEVADIINKLEVIGNQTGLKGKWFRRDEGRFGDGVCYLFDHPEKLLRLYFILYGNAEKDLAIVIGGGGHKPPGVDAFQKVPKLKEENYLLREIAATLNKALNDGELSIDDEGFYSENGLTFKILLK